MKIIDENSRKYIYAKERVEKERKFYNHAMVYIVVNAFFVILNLITSPDHLWFYWPMLGWGLGLALNAVKVFIPYRFFDKEWEEKRIEKLMREDRNF